MECLGFACIRPIEWYVTRRSSGAGVFLLARCILKTWVALYGLYSGSASRPVALNGYYGPRPSRSLSCHDGLEVRSPTLRVHVNSIPKFSRVHTGCTSFLYCDNRSVWLYCLPVAHGNNRTARVFVQTHLEEIQPKSNRVFFLRLAPGMRASVSLQYVISTNA